MKKRGSKLYENPEEMEESELGNVTVASHMSFLTNKRLHEFLNLANANGYQAGTTFQLEDLNNYGQSLWTIYINIESVISDKRRAIILGGFTEFDRHRFKENLVIQKRHKMYHLLSTLHRTMLDSLQNPFQFFFRLETKPIKGLRRTLKMLGVTEDDLRQIPKR